MSVNLKKFALKNTEGLGAIEYNGVTYNLLTLTDEQAEKLYHGKSHYVELAPTGAKSEETSPAKK